MMPGFSSGNQEKSLSLIMAVAPPETTGEKITRNNATPSPP